MGRRLGKKAQLTIFLIIGIILLFSSAIVFYIKGEVIEDTAAVLPQIERVPLELQPLKTFVENCIRDVATDAIKKLGLYGGYIDPENSDYTGTFLTAGYEPTESEVLVFLGDKKIPYWWFLDSDNDCQALCKFASKRPTTNPTGGPTSIVNQINTYIKKEFQLPLQAEQHHQRRDLHIPLPLAPPYPSTPYKYSSYWYCPGPKKDSRHQ